MIHFLLAGARPERFNLIAHGIFELGCRLNTRFVIHETAATLPADGFVVSYGGDLGRLTIPMSQEPPELTQIDGRWLYSSPGPIADVIRGTAALLEFAHESAPDGHRDWLGRINPTANPIGSCLRQPLIENNAAYLKSQIERIAGAIPETSTPFGRDRYAVCITHDVDGPQLHSPFALFRSALYAARGNQHERESLELGLLTRLFGRPDPYWNFGLWQRLERHFGAKSTFLVYPGPLPAAPRHTKDPRYNPTARRFRETLRSLEDEGWEVGSHIGIRGHGEEAYGQAITRIRELGGGKASSVRTHYWAGMSPSPTNAWHEMDAAGFKTDASLSPQAMGYRGGAMMPVMPSFSRRPDLSGLVAVATPLMDAYLVPRTSGLAPREARRHAGQIIENARKNDGLVVLDWHCRTLCNAGAWRGFMPYLVELLKSLAADGSASFMTLAEVGSAWREHCKRCFAGLEKSL